MQAVCVNGKAHIGVVVDDERHARVFEHFHEFPAAFDKGTLFPVRRTQLYAGRAVCHGRARGFNHPFGPVAEVRVKHQINGKIDGEAHQ